MYKTALAAYLAGRQLAINTNHLNYCLTGYARALLPPRPVGRVQTHRHKEQP